MGGTHHPGGEEFWMRREGGVKHFGQAVKGGEKFWTSRQGGANNFGLGQFFFNVPENTIFSCFVGILGTFNFLVKGGAKNFGRVAKGGEIFWILNFLESLGKIKGHV